MNRTRTLPLVLGALLALTGPLPAGPGGPNDEAEKLATGRITVKLVDSDIRDALRMIAKQGGVNIVMSKSVEGPITLDLEDVSLRESLDAVVTVGGVLYTIDNGIVTVATREERIEQAEFLRETEPPAVVDPEVPDVALFTLRYVDAERIKPIVEALLSETGKVSILETSDHVTQDYREPGGSVTQVGDALDLSANLETSSQGRPAKSHKLVVMDLPANLAHIERVIADVDVMPASIVIETRFVEIRLDDENRLGIDWNVVAGLTGGAAPNTFPFGNSSLGEFDPSVEGGGSGGGIFPPAPNSVTTPEAEGLFTFGSLDFTSFTAVLEMIQKDSRAQVVSNPRIVVNDRHTATILVGERFPILSANVSEFGTVTEELERYEPVGVQLVVTPSILEDGEVELFVRPSTSSIGSLVEGTTGIQIARINARQIDTAVTVKDGQTVILGGLITSREAKTTRSVPFLGSLPLFGSLFSHEARTLERIDLVVFLTVRIARETGLTEAQRKLFEETTLDADTRVAQRGDRTELAYGWSAPVF